MATKPKSEIYTTTRHRSPSARAAIAAEYIMALRQSKPETDDEIKKRLAEIELDDRIEEVENWALHGE